MTTPTRAAATLLALTLAAAAHGQVLKLGAMGDSLTDEYSEESYSYAMNWTMQVVQFRGVNMGPTAAAASQPGGTWGEPRRTGYRFNWARYDADSTTALSQGQHTGLAQQAASEGVNCAVVAIGANDFAPTSSAYFNIYWGFWSTPQINSYVSARIANVNTAVTALDNAGLKLIVCNYVDFGVAPVTRQLYGTASRRTRVSNAIAQVNAGIAGIARQHRAALVDLNGLGTTLLGTAASPTQFLPIGSVNIQLFNRDTSGHTNPLAGFVDDGGHPHTTVQGAFANLMMTAVNIQTRAGLVPFSDAEILAHAGIAYPPGGSDTLDAVVGPGGYTRFIRNFRCPADIGSQGGNAGPDGLYDNNDFVAFIDAFFGHNPAADFGGQGGVAGADGLFDNNDFVVFIDAFFQGCA